MKRLGNIISGLLLIASTAYVVNYFTLIHPVSKGLSADPRNRGILYSIHYEYYIRLQTLVIDIREISGEKAPLDVFRSLLQIAQVLKDKSFNSIVLQCKDKEKFRLTGTYFQQLGREYSDQNPIYTIRTFPYQLYLPDGKAAFDPKDDPGILDGLGGELANFNRFAQVWFEDDLIQK